MAPSRMNTGDVAVNRKGRTRIFPLPLTPRFYPLTQNARNELSCRPCNDLPPRRRVWFSKSGGRGLASKKRTSEVRRWV